MTVLAIVGATGAVGESAIELLNTACFPFTDLVLLASARSVGKKYKVLDQEYTVQKLDSDSFQNVNVAVFCASSQIAREFTPIAVNHNCRVIDNSSAFRMTPDIPLVVPEVNRETIGNSMIVANPNCSTILLAVVLAPLHKQYGVERVVVSTYQAASGAGKQAMKELEQQARDFTNGEPYDTTVFGRQYLWNVFSHNSDVDMETGYNEEELKMMMEMPKILDDENIGITATCVRVPVIRSHCESVSLTFNYPISETNLLNCLINSPGVKLYDDRENNQFPEPILTSCTNDVLVGRIRHDLKDPKSFHLFLSGDQLYKGAALNALQIYNLMS